jgi:alpha-D-ribose 1-methylphosphonate 5-triphosphate synthase subunit PhnL
MIRMTGVSKRFTLHNQGAAVIEVMRDADLAVAPGECVALTGPSGAGKSTLMRMIYGNYLAASGAILVGGVDVARAEPREVLELRRTTLGYVSQFLRVIPRVPTLEVVAEPLLAVGTPEPRRSTAPASSCPACASPRRSGPSAPRPSLAASSSG